MIIKEEDSFALESDAESKVILKSIILIPFANLNVTAYVSNEERLLPLEDAILRLYENDIEAFDICKISKLLAVSQQDVKNSYLTLLQREYIDFSSKALTDDGRSYVTTRKISMRRKQNFNLVVNKITGELSYQEESSFIRYKDKQNSYFDSDYEKNPNLNLREAVSIEKAKKIWDHRKTYNDNRFKGDLVELLSISEKGTVYKKFNIFYFLNKQNKVEIRAYERSTRNKSLERFIYEQESSKSILTKETYDFYFNIHVKSNIKNIFEKYENINFDNDKFKSFDFLEKVKSKVEIFLPLTSFLLLDDDLHDYILKLCLLKKEINIFVSGIEETGNRQRFNIGRLIELSKKHQNLVIYSSDKYCPQTFIIDGEYGEYLSPNIVPINISSITSDCVLLELKSLAHNQIDYIRTEIVEQSKECLEIPKEFNIKERAKSVFKLIVEVDDLFSSREFSWLSNSNIVEIKKLFLEIKSTKKKNEYESFTTMLCIKMAENFKKTTAKKRGKAYFDKEFKKEFVELSKALNRIRVYRNSYSHDGFNKFIAEMSYEIIPYDFNNYCPVVLENVYEYKQYKMIDELHQALESTKNILKDIKEIPF